VIERRIVKKRNQPEERVMSRSPKKSQSAPSGAADASEKRRAANEKALHQMEELRSERDHGYGSEYIGDEYKDVKVEDEEKKDEVA
jgi:hypothetical protein